MKLIRTGVPGLDEFLQGGLPPNIFLLQGSTGSGSEIFARQVAYTRAKEGLVTYVTVAKPPQSIKDAMATYGWNITQLEKADAWRFLRVQEVRSLTKTIRKEMTKQRCIVLDSLSELLLTHPLDDVINIITAMYPHTNESKQLHLMLLTEGMHDTRVETAIQHFAEGVILFDVQWGTEASSRRFRIAKLKDALVPIRSLPYSIRKRGFTIETAIRIT